MTDRPASGLGKRRQGGSRPRPLRLQQRIASTATDRSSQDTASVSYQERRDSSEASDTTSILEERTPLRQATFASSSEATSSAELGFNPFRRGSEASFVSSSTDDERRILTMSPEQQSPRSFSPVDSPRLRRQQLPRQPSSLHLSSVDDGPAKPAAATQTSPPRARWDQIRNAIGVPSAPSTTAPIYAPVPLPPLPSSSHTSISGFSPIPQIPHSPAPSGKTARLGRFGFRHVVEQATTTINQDATAKFESDVRRACWEAKYGMGNGDARSEREGFHLSLPTASASTFSLPYTASGSLFGDASSRVGLRQSPSIPQASGPQPSVKPVNQALLAHAPLTTSSTGPSRTTLPLEDDVLSVLLTPFLVNDGGQRLEEERWLAAETFDMIIKTWRSPNAEVEFDRMLWCTKVIASSLPPVRPRILALLSNLLFRNDQAYPIRSPISLQILIQSLTLLRRTISARDPEDRFLQEIITRVRRGDCGSLTAKDLTDEYGVICTALDEDREPDLRQYIVTEGVIRSMQVGSESARRWALHHLEEYWPDDYTPPSTRMTSLEMQIQLRKISTFGQLSLLLTRPTEPLEDPLASRGDSAVLLHIIETRALPELRTIEADIPESAQAKRLIVRVVLDTLCLGSSRVTEAASNMLWTWWEDERGWRITLQKEINDYFNGTFEWSLTIRLLAACLKELQPEVKQVLMIFTLPLFFDRLAEDPPTSSPSLTALLTSFAETVPVLFFKPLFLCAASTKDTTVVSHLRTIAAIARHMPTFWTKDDEMMAVALMNDPGSSMAKGKGRADGHPPWGKSRLGQCVVTLELIAQVKRLINEKKDPNVSLEHSKDPTVRFMINLESRLAIMMDAREESVLLSVSHRILLTWLLSEMRMYIRTLRSAPWLSRVAIWACQAFPGAPLPASSVASPENPPPFVNREDLTDWDTMKEKISSVYNEASDRARPLSARRQSQHRSSFLLAGVGAANAETTAINLDRGKVLSAGPASLSAATLGLLVAVCGLMSHDEYKQLAPPLWHVYMEFREKATFEPASFLFMQCAEKTPAALLPLIQADLSGSDRKLKLRAINCLARLFSWRLQILSQPYIADRARRRPFRLARRPIAFVATDIGSSRYVPPERPEPTKLQISTTLAPEIRRRIIDLGWGENQEEEEEEARRWERAPISLLPHNELELLGSGQVKPSGDNGTDANSRSKGLLRRKSSGSNYISGIKRKAIFVPQLLSLMPPLLKLLNDEDLVLSGATHDLVTIFMRDDPAMLPRPLMEDISDAMQDTALAMTSIRLILHTEEALPPGLAHHLFNHLAGLLKTVTRQSAGDSTSVFAHCLPIMADLVAQVSDLSYRDFTRNKLDHLILPSFTPLTILADSFGKRSMLPNLVFATMTRTAQNLMLLKTLRRSPKDITGIRKAYSTMPVFSIGLTEGLEVQMLRINDFVPRSSTTQHSEPEPVEPLESSLCRSYLLMCTEVFKCFSRHMNNPKELGKYIDGINRILLKRSRDIGIVGHALIAFMTCGTRFRRLFSTDSGFSLFMPVVLKLYCEAEDQPAIREAIEYVTRRFYAIHKEVFVFQTLEAASYIIQQPQMNLPDQEWFAEQVYELISCLSGNIPARNIDAAGISGSNTTNEQEAMITMVNERPEILLGSLSRQQSQGVVQTELPNITAIDSDLPESERFSSDNFVRLFLTIIPHNPFILRAQYFLRLFRLLTRHFYNASASARNVLREGIQAFGTAVFDRVQSRSKNSEKQAEGDPSGLPTETANTAPAESSPSLAYGVKASSPCDQSTMKKEYIHLVVAFMKAGGQFDKWALGRTLHLVRDAVRDNPNTMSGAAASFFDAYTQVALGKDYASMQRGAVAMLREVVPTFRLYGSSMDFTPILRMLCDRCKEQAASSDRDFVRMVVSDWCTAAVEMAHTAASEDALMMLASREAIVSLVSTAVSLPGVDVMAVLERQQPASRFMAGILIPLALQLETAGQVAARSQWQDTWKQEAHKKAWIRLLAYALSAHAKAGKQRAGGKGTISEKSSNLNDPNPEREAAMLSMTAIQLVKIVIVRAEDDISPMLPGIWQRIATFLRDALHFGEATFALEAPQAPIQLLQPSPPLSPNPFEPEFSLASPTEMKGRAFSFDNITVNPPRRSSSGATSVRLVDHLLWSTLELVCLRRTPLLPLLKLWMQEMMLNFEESIRASSLYSPGGPPSPMSRAIRPESRRISRAFAKPRLRTGGRSAGASPEGSPAFGASGGGNLSRSPSLLDLAQGGGQRGPGIDSLTMERYDRFPNASPTPGAGSNIPRIVHLGPAARQDGLGASFGSLGPSNSGNRLVLDEDVARWALKRTSISRPALVQASHLRVRVVQSSMGYDPLPMESEDADIRAWSRVKAIRAVIDDTKDLLEEFHDWFQIGLGKSGSSSL